MKRFCGSKDLLIVACLWVAVLALPVPATAAVIDTDTYLGHTYYLLDGKPWLDQEAEAIALGGHLVTINDAAENTWVWDTFAPVEGGLFFGFNDFAAEGNWVWASGEPVTFTAWRFLEPNNCCGGEDFGELASDYQWNDVGPNHTWRAVAEVGADPTAVPEPTSLLLLGTGAMGLVAKARRRKQR